MSEPLIGECRVRFYLTLYFKELRKLKRIFLTFLLIQVIIDLLVIFLDIKPYGKTYSNLGSIISFTVFAHPFILAYIYLTEWKTNSNYQLLSLPVPRYTVIFCKYIAVLTLCIFFSLGMVIWTCIFSMNERTYDPRIPEPALYDFVVWPLMNLTLTFVLLGVVSLIESIHYAIKRNWILIGIIVFILCTFGYVGLTNYLVLAGINGILYNIATGIFFLLIGLFFLKKYGEV